VNALSLSTPSESPKGGASFLAVLEKSLRQRERVFEMLSLGFGKKRIARALHMSLTCVSNHYRRLAERGRIRWDPEKIHGGGWVAVRRGV